MTINKLIDEAIEQCEYDLPYSTIILLKNMCRKMVEIVNEYVPKNCTTCNHENCTDCDGRLDGWQIGDI